MIELNTFDPALLSFPDCDFLLAHAGEPPIVALKSLPANANRTTMTEWIARFYELEEQEKCQGITWVGVEAVKTAIRTYLAEREKWSRQASHGAPKFPSMYAFDARGNGHLSGSGSDSGRVKTYFDAKGNRLKFALHLNGDGEQTGWKPDWITAGAGQPNREIMKITEVPGKNALACGVPECGHTETFKPESRTSIGAARARMSKHLRKAKSEQEAHLELHTLEFGS